MPRRGTAVRKRWPEVPRRVTGDGGVVRASRVQLLCTGVDVCPVGSVAGAHFVEKERDYACGKENEGQQKAANQKLRGALLLRTRAGNAKRIDESFGEPGEKLHRPSQLG